MDTKRKGAKLFANKINEQAKQIIYNVYSFFKLRKRDQSSIEYQQDVNLNKLVAQATGISVTTISKIVREGNDLKREHNTVIFTPQEKVKQIGKKKIEIDKLTEALVRRKVIQFYTIFKTVPSIRKLLATLKEERILNCGREYLRLLLHKLGFNFKKCHSKVTLLIEQPNIVSLRRKYLNAIKTYRSDNKHIVYLTETYINFSNNEPGVLSHSGKGPKYIIIHAGGQTGFVNEAPLIFESKSESGDYHNKINFENYIKYTKEKLLPKLSPRSVIVVDNVACNSVQEDGKPTITHTKAAMQAWLQKHNIKFDISLSKSDLFELIKQQSENIYKIDDVIKAAGHEIFRLPPYHPDLNPLEIVFADIKRQLSKKEYDINLVGGNKTALEKLFKEFSEEKWIACVSHVQKIEDEYCENDLIVDDIVDKLITNFQPDSSNQTESEDESSMMDTDLSEDEYS